MSEPPDVVEELADADRAVRRIRARNGDTCVALVSRKHYVAATREALQRQQEFIEDADDQRAELVALVAEAQAVLDRHDAQVRRSREAIELYETTLARLAAGDAL